MKCEKAEKSILLAQSGELSKFGRWQLQKHADSCQACRTFRLELLRLSQLAKDNIPELNPTVTENILRVARQEQSHSTEIHWQPESQPPVPVLRLVFLYASVIVVIIAGTVIYFHPASDPTLVTAPSVTASGEMAAMWDDSSSEDISILSEELLASNGDSDTEESWDPFEDSMTSLEDQLSEIEEMEI